MFLNALKYHRQQSGLKIHAYCLMENHFHLIADHDDLSKCIQSINSFTAKNILDILQEQNNLILLKQLKFSKLKGKRESVYQVWQEGFHPKTIFNEKMMEQKINYIHYNPVERGYVDLPQHWRYSSARNYEGLPGLIEIDLINM